MKDQSIFQADLLLPLVVFNTTFRIVFQTSLSLEHRAYRTLFPFFFLTNLQTLRVTRSLSLEVIQSYYRFIKKKKVFDKIDLFNTFRKTVVFFLISFK